MCDTESSRQAVPIVVHPPLGTGGRRVAVRGQMLGLAHSDADVIEFLRRTGLPEAERLLDDEAWVTWRGGRAHHYGAA
ncbi:hypothetical protein G6045_28560 [Streptomyces sp. YC504]|uniref:Uncharacterized protein n=1 Tax=Streptomyces mesophilus TaxID=1775132 RepID=A0A6G4XRZ4_9ACTN|nr:hypothetical protein [Streptomyces mesophilus]NGO79577.1 hypothetical protein [Streptomyces mesophilus]